MRRQRFLAVFHKYSERVLLRAQRLVAAMRTIWDGIIQHTADQGAAATGSMTSLPGSPSLVPQCTFLIHSINVLRIRHLRFLLGLHLCPGYNDAFAARRTWQDVGRMCVSLCTHQG